MRISRLLIPGLAVVALSGCAHNMIMTPDVSTLVPAAGSDRIAKNVGLYISAVHKAVQSTTPGGGGDKVTYHPYCDMETGIYAMLGNVFQGVTSLNSPTDSGAIASHSLSYIIEPEITTNSSSSGILTWMATDFTVELTCKINDAAGHSVTSVAATGKGHADFSELKSNFSLAGERASQDALQKMQALLLQAAELRK